MVTHQLQASESSPVKDRRSTTELHRQQGILICKKNGKQS